MQVILSVDPGPMLVFPRLALWFAVFTSMDGSVSLESIDSLHLEDSVVLVAVRKAPVRPARYMRNAEFDALSLTQIDGAVQDRWASWK